MESQAIAFEALQALLNMDAATVEAGLESLLFDLL